MEAFFFRITVCSCHPNRRLSVRSFYRTQCDDIALTIDIILERLQLGCQRQTNIEFGSATGWIPCCSNYTRINKVSQQGHASLATISTVPCRRTIFSVHVTVHRYKFLYNKTNQMHQFPKFPPAWNSTCFGQFLCPSWGVYWCTSCRFSDSFRAGPGCNCSSIFALPIIRSLFTVHSALVYVIRVFRQLSSRTRMELQFHPGPARKLSTDLYNIHQCRVYSE